MILKFSLLDASLEQDWQSREQSLYHETYMVAHLGLFPCNICFLHKNLKDYDLLSRREVFATNGLNTCTILESRYYLLLLIAKYYQQLPGLTTSRNEFSGLTMSKNELPDLTMSTFINFL